MVLQKSPPVTAKIKCLNSYDPSDLSNLTMIAKYCQCILCIICQHLHIYKKGHDSWSIFPLMESLDRQSSLWDCTVSRCFKNSKLHKLHKSWGKTWTHSSATHHPSAAPSAQLATSSLIGGKFGPRKVHCILRAPCWSLRWICEIRAATGHRAKRSHGPGVPRTPHTTWSTSPTPCYIVKCSKQGSRRSEDIHHLQHTRSYRIWGIVSKIKSQILRKAPGDSDPKTCARLDSSWCWIPDKQFHWPHEQHLRGMLLDILSGGLCTKGFVVDPCSTFCHRHSAKVARPHRHTCAAYLHMKHCRWKRDPAARTSNTVCSNRQYLRILRMHCFHPQRSHQSQHTTSVPWMLPSWVAFDIFGSDECRDGT